MSLNRKKLLSFAVILILIIFFSCDLMDQGKLYLSSLPISKNQLPVITISSPTDGGCFNESFYDFITIDVNASDPDGSISYIEFFQDETKLGQAEVAPYTFNWNNVNGGSLYSLTAIAHDNQGGTTVSDAVDILVGDMSTINLATQGIAVADTEIAGYEAAKAIDQNTNTYWASEINNPHWIYIDLKSLFIVNLVVINWHWAYSSQYIIQASENTLNWRVVYTEASGDGGIDDISFDPVDTRYVRMYGLAGVQPSDPNWNHNIYEFEIYGEGKSSLSE